jgi:hypothetical protein
MSRKRPEIISHHVRCVCCVREIRLPRISARIPVKAIPNDFIRDVFTEKGRR